MDLKTRLKTRFTGIPDPKPAVSPEPASQSATPKRPVEPMNLRSMSPTEQDWMHRVHQKLLSIADLSLLGELDDKNARLQVRELAQKILDEDGAPLTMPERQHVTRTIEDEILGLGPLEPLLADPNVSDIMVNGHNQVYIERFGKLELTSVRFQNESHLLNVIDRIVSSVGRRVDESVPMVDARLKDGSRVNAIVPPLALDGSALSIRRAKADHLRTQDLIGFKALTPMMAAVLAAAVEARLNIIVSGGTGSGKTTMLNALSSSIPEDERIVTIEDAAELRLQQTHIVRLETRPPNIEGRGEVTARDLVRNCLRMRPDRIVIGECRGEEAFDMLQAMNTGHDGSLTTVHANTPRDAIARIENLVAMAGLDLPTRAIRAQIASAVNLVVQVSRLEDGKRKVVSVQEINGMEGDIITMSEIFTFQRRGVDESGNVIGRFRATGTVPKFFELVKKRGIGLDLSAFDMQRDEGWDDVL
jgi:pilus assembly protein CpaF